MLDIIHEIAHAYPGGSEALAHRMGKNPGTLRKKLLPNEDSHDLTVKELRQIVDFTNTDRIAQAFADDRGLLCIKKPDFDGFSDKEILDLFLDLQAQQGEWAREIHKAMNSGDITAAEMRDIQKEYNDFIVASAEVMSRLQSLMTEPEKRKLALATK